MTQGFQYKKEGRYKKCSKRTWPEKEVGTYMDVVKDIGAVLGCISVFIGLLCTISEKVREWIVGLFKRKQKVLDDENKIDCLCKKLDKYIESDIEFKTALQTDMKVQKDFAKDQCRNNIKEVFYRYCNTKKIPLYEYKTAASAFKTYSEKLGGNSYISLLFHEMEKWDIDYTHSFEEDDH